MKELKINSSRVKGKLIDFIQKSVRSSGFKRVVLGLSGGLDSSTVACLSARALGPKNVIGIIMPYKTTQKRDIIDAKKLSKTLGIQIEYIDISNMVDAYFKKIDLKDNLRRGNKMARERMSILYDHSKECNALVIGTGNKTEILLGYGTMYGDMACAINPLGELYKTQVIQLAKSLKVPASVINKPPSAGFWKGQTDENELGFKYKDIDMLLYYLIDKKYTMSQLLKKGFDVNFICSIKEKIKNNTFKSKLPKIAKLT